MAASASHSIPSSFCFLLVVIFVQQISCVDSIANSFGMYTGNGKLPGAVGVNNQSSCNLFVGNWVVDSSYPMYLSSCSIIDPEFNCQMFGRPDMDYLKYRWQPRNCQIPRFNGSDFAVKMRGRSIMFVGDSLGRNQWQSLICMISAGLAASSPTEIIRADPLSTFKFLEYELSVSFYKAPYLVDIVSGKIDGKRVLKLDDISNNAEHWMAADLLSFNTGHWWTHKGSLKGWDFMEAEDGSLYQDMDRLVAFERGLRTWTKWINKFLDTTKTKVFFQGISPTHYNPSEWKATSSSKSCYGETVPLNDASRTKFPDQMKVLHAVLGSMSKPPFLLDITLLSAMRKDAHPSIYTGDLNSHHSPDCSHWCLPGLPDTWNHLFYTALFFSH